MAESARNAEMDVETLLRPAQCKLIKAVPQVEASLRAEVAVAQHAAVVGEEVVQNSSRRQRSDSTATSKNTC